MNPIMVIDLFDIKGIDYIRAFVSYYGVKYILVAVDFVSKWVEEIVLPYDEGKSVSAFLQKIIFYRFGTPRVIIRD